jgi:hypothetical protein
VGEGEGLELTSRETDDGDEGWFNRDEYESDAIVEEFSTGSSQGLNRE